MRCSKRVEHKKKMGKAYDRKVNNEDGGTFGLRTEGQFMTLEGLFPARGEIQEQSMQRSLVEPK